MKKETNDALPKGERRLIEARKRHVNLKEAAASLGIKPRTAYNVASTIRHKYAKARRYVNTLDANTRGDPALRKEFTARPEEYEATEEGSEE